MSKRTSGPAPSPLKALTGWLFDSSQLPQVPRIFILRWILPSFWRSADQVPRRSVPCRPGADALGGAGGAGFSRLAGAKLAFLGGAGLSAAPEDDPASAGSENCAKSNVTPAGSSESARTPASQGRRERAG